MKQFASIQIGIDPFSTPLEIRPILENFYIFNDKVEMIDNITIGKYVGLPKAVMLYYEQKFNKSGRELLAKMTKILSLGPYSIFGMKITAKQGPIGFLEAGILNTLTKIAPDPILQFCNGIGVINMSEDELDENMAMAAAWLPVPVRKIVKVIK